MREIYVLAPKGVAAQIALLADDFERCNMAMAPLDEEDQQRLEITNMTVYEDGD